MVAEFERQPGGVELADRSESGELEFEVGIAEYENTGESEGERATETAAAYSATFTNEFSQVNGRWVADITTAEGALLAQAQLLEHDEALRDIVMGLSPGQSLTNEKIGETFDTKEAVMNFSIYTMTERGTITVEQGQREITLDDLAGGPDAGASFDFASGEGGTVLNSELGLLETSPPNPPEAPFQAQNAKPKPKKEPKKPWWEELSAPKKTHAGQAGQSVCHPTCGAKRRRKSAAGVDCA